MTYLNKEFQLLAILLFLLLTLILNLNVSAAEKLIFAVTLTRHGERTAIYDIESAPYKWEIGKGELTALGMKQQNELGSELRKRYVDKFKLLSAKYVNNEV